MPTPQGRYWVATISCDHLPTQPILKDDIIYLKGQKEIGAGGFIHWQVLAVTSRKCTLRQVKQALHESAHVELSRSEAANEYVWKEDTRVPETQFELGNLPVSRARKEDWSAVWNSAKAGDMEAIPDDIRIRHYNTIKRIRVDYERPSCRPDIEVKVLIGPSGVGKTTKAFSEAGDTSYLKNSRTKWWDGYRGETNVIIDEFAGMIDITYLLSWFDKFPCTVEVKGGQMVLKATKFWVTSNLNIDDWFPNANREHVIALKRRVNIEYIESLEC